MSKKEPSAPASPTESGTAPPHDGWRDSIESIIFAFLLALLFKTFEAEMFVIPTGSMAPTLYGRHKEATCSECGHHIVVGASSELDHDDGTFDSRVTESICPNCRAINPQIFDGPPFNGDRICVAKYPYEFWEPSRWDVFVFKFPLKPQTNYIKRLVGLPGETIRLRNGNVYLWDGEKEQILRKAPDKQRAIQIPVHDNAYVSEKLLAAGWPERWAAVVRTEDVAGIDGWKETDASVWKFNGQTRSFAVDSSNTEWAWVRYRHYAPGVQDWRDVEEDRKSIPQPRLVGDFCSYNAFDVGPLDGKRSRSLQIDEGPFWVPDLTVSCQLKIESVSQNPEVMLELTEGVLRYRCRIDVSTGSAILEEVNVQMSEQDVRQLVTVETSLRGPGTYDLEFANVDDRLCLWINGRLVEFGESANLTVPGATSNPFPTDGDLTPVGVAAHGVQATLSELRISRDIYYRGVDAEDSAFLVEDFVGDLSLCLSEPSAWSDTYMEKAAQYDYTEIVIPEDRFLALGDNSPASYDGRLWTGTETVPREFLVGKAFCVYWPHGVPFLNGGNGYSCWPFYHKTRRGEVTDYPTHTFPFYPQFWRMKRIR
ncbi:MAG: signal peptidase I [Planctomycetaceae bacterium]|nr:signal peptidase I [Planctomycetaceae bacterium]MCA9043465.1 signal peptidase I [Planctomycetaceae bacterium]MCB9953478.1 signal peptidase I [Planctomycetaceae bacterium]